MKTTKILAAFTLTFFVVSCSEKKEIEINQADEQMVHEANGLDVEVDNKFDPICGMEAAEHVSDTIHYEGKVYGFCSSGCKEEFAKNPAQYLDKLN